MAGRLVRVWLAYAAAHVRRILEYRGSFVLGVAAIASRHAMSLLGLWVLFRNVRSLGGWSEGEVLFLYGFVSVVTAIWHFFFANTLRMEMLVEGELDWYLVRPLPALFQVLLYYFDDDAIGDLVPGVVLLAWSSHTLGVRYDLPTALALGAGLAGGVLVHFGIHLAISSWSFWFVKSRALILVFTETRRFSEYPLRMFAPPIQLVLSLVVPLAFAGFHASEAVLRGQLATSLAWLSLPVGLAIWLAGMRLWHHGLSRYQGTGS